MPHRQLEQVLRGLPMDLRRTVVLSVHPRNPLLTVVVLQVHPTSPLQTRVLRVLPRNPLQTRVLQVIPKNPQLPRNRLPLRH